MKTKSPLNETVSQHKKYGIRNMRASDWNNVSENSNSMSSARAFQNTTKLITKLKINFIENFHHVMHFASFPLAQRKTATTEKNSMLHLAELFFFFVCSTPYSEIIVFCQGSS